MADQNKTTERVEKADPTPKGLPSPAKDAGVAQVQARVDREQEQGYSGRKIDPTPNHAYTLEGVIAGEPTPETDAEAARAAREATTIGLSPIEAAAKQKKEGK